MTTAPPGSPKENEKMLCSIVAHGNLHVFQVTAGGELRHGSHAAGADGFPFDTVTDGCDPHVAPSAQVFNDNLHVFAQKVTGDVVWSFAPHGGKWNTKVLGA